MKTQENLLRFKSLAVAAAALFAGMSFGGQSPPLEEGEVMGYFDFHRHVNNPAKRTFAGNHGHCRAAVLLENGDVTVYLSDDMSDGNPAALYTIRLDPADYNKFTLVSGPVVPSCPQIPISFNYMTRYGPDSYAWLGEWTEDWNTEPIKRHKYILTCSRANGNATILCKLPEESDGVPIPVGGIVYVPGNGQGEDTFLMASRETDKPADFWLINSAGTVVRKFSGSELHFNTNPRSYCYAGINMAASTNREFIARINDDRYDLPDCSTWGNFSCVRFDLNGAFKGAWDYGGTMYKSGPLPEDSGPFVQLANGDVLSFHYFAHIDTRDGDRDGSTFRNYVLRPPRTYTEPRCAVTPLTTWLPTTRPGTPTESTVRVANVGSAPLQVSSVTFEGTNSSYFSIKGNQGFALAPGYGSPDTPGAFRDVVVSGNPTQAGEYTAKIVVASNDPQEPKAKADVTVVGFSASYTNLVLLSPGSLPGPAASVSIKAGETSALTLVRVERADGASLVRALWIPLLRNASNQITGFDANNTSVAADNLPESVTWILQGPENQMWYGPVPTGGDIQHPATLQWGIAQRKPDGSERRQFLGYDILKNLSAAWVPGESALLVALTDLRAPLRYDYTPRADGFYDLKLKASLNSCALPLGIPLTAVTVLPNSKQQICLAYSTVSGLATLYRGWTTHFWMGTETPSPAKGVIVASARDIAQFSLDPATGDFIYVTKDGEIRRMTGILEGLLWPAHIPFQVKHVSWDHFYGSDWFTVNWEDLKFPVAVESSTDMRNWSVVSPTASHSTRYLEMTNQENRVFLRLEMDDGR